jgi:hypothetical protein
MDNLIERIGLVILQLETLKDLQATYNWDLQPYIDALESKLYALAITAIKRKRG